jgi:hypothetical protein
MELKNQSIGFYDNRGNYRVISIYQYINNVFDNELNYISYDDREKLINTNLNNNNWDFYEILINGRLNEKNYNKHLYIDYLLKQEKRKEERDKFLMKLEDKLNTDELFAAINAVINKQINSQLLYEKSKIFKNNNVNDLRMRKKFLNRRRNYSHN